jgi:hypothetical protein
MQDYYERLRPSDIAFEKMEIWARINIPLGWMNDSRGARAMGLIGAVKKMDVDKHGKANGPYLRGRVVIDVNKPVRRGVLLKTKKTRDAEWFDVQYEKLPFYCLNCGVMGHSELQCQHPLIRNTAGKLSYDAKLRAQDGRRRKLQGLVEAASVSAGSDSQSSSQQSRNRTPDRRAERNDGGEDDEIMSPLKATGQNT